MGSFPILSQVSDSKSIMKKEMPVKDRREILSVYSSHKDEVTL